MLSLCFHPEHTEMESAVTRRIEGHKNKRRAFSGGTYSQKGNLVNAFFLVDPLE